MTASIHDIARRLAGDVSRRDSIICPGPGHSRHDRSLSVRFDTAAPDGFLVYSFAGDDVTDCRDHVRTVLGLHGSRSNFGRAPAVSTSSPSASEANREYARRLWSETRAPAGSPVETYLASRGIRLAPPSSLRFHPSLAHPCGTIWPAMVALVRRGTDGEPLGIHRTFLAKNGAAKASVEPNKMMLGPCRGGAVRFAPAGEMLMVGEGIETCLSVMQSTGHPAWAALSTSGLRSLEIPDTVKEIILLADGDDAGERAARDCATRWTKEGRHVRIARPPRGMDFNDLLLIGEAV